MNKCLWLLFVLTIIVLPVHAQQEKPIITVLDFTADHVSQAEMRSIISLLSSSLFKTDFFTVIDVSQRETVLKELQFSLSGCSDESCMLEIGKLLSAEAIVIGSIGRVGSKYVFSAKMLETETAKTLSTADGIYADLDALLENINSVALDLSKPYGKAGAAPSVAATKEKPPRVKPEREPRPPKAPVEPGAYRVPAWATLAGGAASAGVGTYFLVVSLPLIRNYQEAKDAYASADLSMDVTALWNAYEEARAAAVEGNANRNFILGLSLAGTGLVLGTVSVLLFTLPGSRATPAEPESPSVSAFLLPLPGAAVLSFHCRF